MSENNEHPPRLGDQILKVTLKPQWKRLGRTLEWILSKESVRGGFGMFRVHEYIATVIAMSYLERGDKMILSDDKALRVIRNLLLTYDPDIIERNRNKKIPLKYRKIMR